MYNRDSDRRDTKFGKKCWPNARFLSWSPFQERWRADVSALLVDNKGQDLRGR
jgi:hypothetical protein